MLFLNFGKYLNVTLYFTNSHLFLFITILLGIYLNICRIQRYMTQHYTKYAQYYINLIYAYHN